MSSIYNIYGTDAHAMTRKLLEASNAIALVPSGGSVALKPNLVVAGDPDDGATTHPGVLTGCIEYFREGGFSGAAEVSYKCGSFLYACGVCDSSGDKPSNA